jgi:CubicO group peptidase (beta-lactamase class C family)
MPLLAQAFGQAVIETTTPNTTATAFQIASLSKQFTAFAVHLLASDAKLSLDDDVRRHIPELHAFDRPITIRHLLHHTSGIRELSVAALKGRFEAEVAQASLLRTLYDQRELNFAPGVRHSYSNSNYTLLALIVERVSGQSLNDFLTTRVFKPLGMKNSYVQDDLRKIRANEAWPYSSGKGGPERALHIYQNYGSTNLRSTADDMALWMMNLDRPKVGSAALTAAMLEAGKDSEGKKLAYASGFEVGEYRGAKAVRHSGIDPGYGSYFLRFPDHRFGVAIMCNIDTTETQEIAHRIADIYLGDRLHSAEKQERPEISLNEQELKRFAGYYKEEDGMLFAVEARNGQLFIQGDNRLVPVGAGEFSLPGRPVTFSFEGEAGAPATTLVVHDPGTERKSRRIRKEIVPDLTLRRMRDYTGHYYSPELRTVVRVDARKDAMWLVGADYEVRIEQPPQPFRERDTFSTQHLMGGLRFVRDNSGDVSELLASNGRVVNLRFVKVPALSAVQTR